MTRNLEGRLSKLEAVAGTGRDILVWCDDEDQVEATVAAMIERGEIEATDRVHCVHWLRGRGQPGAHERSLEELT